MSEDRRPGGLECHRLTVTYGSVVAVDRVSLRLAAGEILGLLGPNGAGKTSMIRALTTIVPVTSGTATIAGHDLKDSTAVRSVIGVLPESNGYPASMSAPAYLRFHGRLFGMSRGEADERAGRLLHRMGLGGVTGRIGTYSRGMRQRLGLCRCLMNSPAVLFLDEPTLGLDPAGQDEILRHLARIAIEDGTSVILCSHLLDEVERVCDRVAVLHRGSIVARGTVDEVVAAAGVAGRCVVRVAPAQTAVAAEVLRGSPAVVALDFDNSRPGDLVVELARPAGARMDLLRDLLGAGVEPLSFDLQGGRLSEAFLALTERVSEAIT